MNRLGYDSLGRGDLDAALLVFELNTEAYPEAFNTWDSLGEVLLARQAYERSRVAYERSLALDADNDNARVLLARIDDAATSR